MSGEHSDFQDYPIDTYPYSRLLDSSQHLPAPEPGRQTPELILEDQMFSYLDYIIDDKPGYDPQDQLHKRSVRRAMLGIVNKYNGNIPEDRLDRFKSEQTFLSKNAD